MSLSGSQNKSFSFNVPPTKHASCRAAPKPRLFQIFTHPYPNLPKCGRRSSPRVPPVLRKCSVQEQARPLRRSPGLVGRAVSPRWGATWAECARGGGHFRLRRKAPVCPWWKLEGNESHHSRATFAPVAPAAPTTTSVGTRWCESAQRQTRCGRCGSQRVRERRLREDNSRRSFPDVCADSRKLF
jgi:hypothetical protein